MGKIKGMAYAFLQSIHHYLLQETGYPLMAMFHFFKSYIPRLASKPHWFSVASSKLLEYFCLVLPNYPLGFLFLCML